MWTANLKKIANCSFNHPCSFLVYYYLFADCQFGNFSKLTVPCCPFHGSTHVVVAWWIYFSSQITMYILSKYLLFWKKSLNHLILYLYMTTQRFRVNMTNHSGLTVQSVNLDHDSDVLSVLLRTVKLLHHWSKGFQTIISHVLRVEHQ